jgi:cytochrome c551/c552
MRPHLTTLTFLTLSLTLLFFAGCGGAADDSGTTTPDPSASQSSLTADQIEKGIGPVSEVNLGTIDSQMAAAGEAIFTSKCAACHKMDSRYVGPALGDVTLRRAPEFIMNMMLNPDQMIKEHPVGKEMFATFMTPMPNQNLSMDDARQILEYLRTQAPSSE